MPTATSNEILPSAFYDRPALEVAHDLLGMRLVRLLGNNRLAGIIYEVEAYQGEEDLACHARVGKTARNAVMYGRPGLAYVYFTYGMHWCLNAVTGPGEIPSAVLIRGILPVEGLDIIAARRSGQPKSHWTDGPAKICAALGIDGQQNGADLCSTKDGLWVERGNPPPPETIQHGARIGIASVPEPWRSLPWRLWFTLPDQ
jgi:DNA-3-methyladenine glycosylase